MDVKTGGTGLADGDLSLKDKVQNFSAGKLLSRDTPPSTQTSLAQLQGHVGHLWV